MSYSNRLTCCVCSQVAGGELGGLHAAAGEITYQRKISDRAQALISRTQNTTESARVEPTQ